MSRDTIAAIATPPGVGGVGIVRLSGEAVPAIANQFLGQLPVPRRALLQRFLADDGEPIDEGLVLYFPAPHSYTGEEVLELHGHGGPVVLDLLLQRVLALGARLARPGEFTERAFLNGKLDLARAEAVADLIEAGTAQAVRAAMVSLSGVFSRRVDALVEGLIELRMYIEATIDFAEEAIDFLSDGQVSQRLAELHQHWFELRRDAGQGRLLRDGMTVVIAGRPNAGKSSLLNQLSGQDSAIVTAIAGTTRDVLRERIQLDGMPLHVLDTAGLRDSDDPVEQEGIRRAWREIAAADRVVVVLDAVEGLGAAEEAIRQRLPDSLPLTVVRNKIDLTELTPGEAQGEWGTEIRVSAKTAAGIDALREHLKHCMGYTGGGEGLFSARRRHLDALERGGHHLQAAQQQLDILQASELVAEELRLAHQCFGEITGTFTADDLLGRIFSSFCIGK